MDKTVQNIEKMILNRDFNFAPPYFYNNDLALRCELGIGDTDEEYINNAKERAAEIFDILFANGVDMFFFHDLISDWDFDMDTVVYIRPYVSMVKNSLEFSLGYQKRFEHKIVRDIPLDEDDCENDVVRKNRVCCYPDKKFNAIDTINAQINKQNNPTIHLVSFSNNCIFTVYDDRGCDIVFYDKGNFLKFYPLLQKYFLEYDLTLMKQRFDNAKN